MQMHASPICEVLFFQSGLECGSPEVYGLVTAGNVPASYIISELP